MLCNSSSCRGLVRSRRLLPAVLLCSRSRLPLLLPAIGGHTGGRLQLLLPPASAPLLLQVGRISRWALTAALASGRPVLLLLLLLS